MYGKLPVIAYSQKIYMLTGVFLKCTVREITLVYYHCLNTEEFIDPQGLQKF